MNLNGIIGEDNKLGPSPVMLQQTYSIIYLLFLVPENIDFFTTGKK